MIAATKLPTMLPMPPITTTAKASMISVMSMSRLADTRSMSSPPARPASTALSTNTDVNKSFWLTPSAETMSRSWIAARSSTPHRVLWKIRISAMNITRLTANISM